VSPNPYILLSRLIQQELKEEVAKLSAPIVKYRPGLAIVQVGGREDSNVYIRMKIKAAEEIGIEATHHKLPRTITEAEVEYSCSKSL
jgi:methylenetetrahydrofolate dehydrogenase (NADP+)/methenyltetrahydrofolate cyclohydrolase/formyltetrahydrofolate synthetase